MAKFVVNTHGRLQEWIADEKGYFTQEGLDYELTQHALLSKMAVDKTTGKVENSSVPDNLNGAYQTYEKGRDASISCACTRPPTAPLPRQPAASSRTTVSGAERGRNRRRNMGTRPEIEERV